MGNARAPRHDQSDYSSAIRSLLPTGPAWEIDHENLTALIEGLAEVFAEPLDRIAALFLDQESDPRFTRQLLEDWEKAFGLPDECISSPQTIEDRIAALLHRMTMQGAQSRLFFIGMAKSLGYAIQIVEFSPFIVGVSSVGDTRNYTADDYVWRIGPPEMRFHWIVKVLSAKVSWFRAASGVSGVDHHVEFSLADDLECIIRRYKPAHTNVIFDYSGLEPLSSTSGSL